jgi:hypothetical protein
MLHGERGLQNGLDFTPVDYSCQDSFAQLNQTLSSVESQPSQAFCREPAQKEFLLQLFRD